MARKTQTVDDEQEARAIVRALRAALVFIGPLELALLELSAPEREVFGRVVRLAGAARKPAA